MQMKRWHIYDTHSSWMGVEFQVCDVQYLDAYQSNMDVFKCTMNNVHNTQKISLVPSLCGEGSGDTGMGSRL